MKPYAIDEAARLATEIYNSIRLSDRTPLYRAAFDAGKDDAIFGEASRRAAQLFREVDEKGTLVFDSTILAIAREIETKFDL